MFDSIICWGVHGWITTKSVAMVVFDVLAASSSAVKDGL